MSTPADFANLFEEFRKPSWSAWRRILSRITPDIREFVCIAGRGGGKSRIISLIGACFACRKYRVTLGENIYVGVFAPDRKQARLTFRYILGLLQSVPQLNALIKTIKREEIELINGVIIEVVTANAATLRGRSYGCAIIEEAAFLPMDESSANPDTELLRALRPAVARVPNGILCVISSPYARRGILYDYWTKYGAGQDPEILVIKASTQELNPTFSESAIKRAKSDDLVSANTEYGAEFRSDIESFVSLDAVEACKGHRPLSLSPVDGITYQAFVDPSGGRHDAFALAIGHTIGGLAGGTGEFGASPTYLTTAVIDHIEERDPRPVAGQSSNFFSPENVVRDFAEILARYRIKKVVGDRYAGEWPRESFARHGITYEPADKPKSDLYRDCIPLINGARLNIPDHDKLISQIVSLERTTRSGGRVMIDHPPGGCDDLANVVCGLATNLIVPVELEHEATW